LRSGLIMAVFRAGGTLPDRRESFITVVIRGLRTDMFIFSRDVGKGSRAQVVDFILLIIFSTSCCVISGKQCRGSDFWEAVQGLGDCRL